MTSLIRTTATADSGANIGHEEYIQPLFQRNCCAGLSAAAMAGGLIVLDATSLLVGSTRGDVVVPGDLNASLPIVCILAAEHIAVGAGMVAMTIVQTLLDLTLAANDDCSAKKRPNVAH